MTIADQGRPLQGVAWRALSGLVFVGVNGVVKALGTDVPAAQSAFIRFAFGVVFFLPMLPALWRARFSAPVWRLFGWRDALHVAAVVVWFHAMARVPVAEISAIAFLNPVIVRMIAGLALGEGLSARRIAVVAVALTGAMIVLRPGLREVPEGHVAQLATTQLVTFHQIIWSTGLGALVFDEVLDAWVIAGGGLIIGAVSLNTWIEARRGQEPDAVAVDA